LVNSNDLFFRLAQRLPLSLSQAGTCPAVDAAG
jgi:hypothetical protein